MENHDLFSIKNWKESSACIFLIIGIIAYASAYFLIEDKTIIWREILLKIGDILVIGVILGYLTNVSKLLGIFKSELQDIVYAKEFLKERKDVDKIWETVSKEMFKSKFPAVHKELLTMIKSYMPIKNVSYYENYNVSIDLSWADKTKKLIRVKNSIDFDLIAENKDSFSFPLKSWIDVTGLEKTDYYVKAMNYTVNNEQAHLLSEKSDVKNGIHEYEYNIELKGDTKYEISKVIEKQYSIEKDYTICFQAQYMVNKLTVEIFFPDDIQVAFIPRGTLKEYNKMNTPSNNLKRVFKGLLLPKQGYVIALREKNS